MIGRQGNLRGPDEIEVVGRNRIDLLTIGREEAGAVQGLLSDQHRRNHRSEAVGQEVVEGISNQGELEQDRLTLQVSETAARNLGAAIHVHQIEAGAEGGEVRRREIEHRRSADPLDLLVVGIGHAVGGGVVDQIGNRRPDLVELRRPIPPPRRRASCSRRPAGRPGQSRLPSRDRSRPAISRPASFWTALTSSDCWRVRRTCSSRRTSSTRSMSRPRRRSECASRSRSVRRMFGSITWADGTPVSRSAR